MVSRRTMIAGGAGAAVLAALGYRAWDRGAFTTGDGPAFEAWQEWQGHAGEDPALRPLHAAILASSAHNTQPWLFEPHEGSIAVYADLSRNLGAADPFRRELFVSIGCALYNLRLAAADLGFAISDIPVTGRLSLNPDARLVKVTDVTLKPAETVRFSSPRPFYEAIGKRHTNRGPYRRDREVPPVCCSVFGDSTKLVTDSGARRDLGALIVEATERFIADRQMSRDSSGWFRTGRREIEAHRDGISTDTAGLSPVLGAVAKLLPDQDAASADRYWLSSTRDVQTASAPAYAVVFDDDRLRIDTAVATGERWQMHHLWLTALGLAAQPMNQPVEIIDRDDILGRRSEYAKEIRKIAHVQDGDPAFIFRLGYAERDASPSPRRRLDDVIRRSGFA